MYIDTFIGGRRFGGYRFDTADIAVEYFEKDDSWESNISAEILGIFMTKYWLGMKAPGKLTLWNPSEPVTVVSAGEIITDQHIEQLSAAFFQIVAGPEWAGRLEQCRLWCKERQRAFLTASESDRTTVAVEIKITDPNCRAQQSANLVLTAEAAHWLGMQLIKFGRGAEGKRKVEKASFPAKKEGGTMITFPIRVVDK